MAARVSMLSLGIRLARQGGKIVTFDTLVPSLLRAPPPLPCSGTSCSLPAARSRCAWKWFDFGPEKRSILSQRGPSRFFAISPDWRIDEAKKRPVDVYSVCRVVYCTFPRPAPRSTQRFLEPVDTGNRGLEGGETLTPQGQKGGASCRIVQREPRATYRWAG
ncbi:hypothetical protein GQ53DRAFT_21781 [Thozetella sp. PMI_491]|nr:hypothetical protein GQ53DRAFT_21781 [Thozetella sp. PMI_491]